MAKYYEHTQIGYLIITALAIGVSFLVYLLVTGSFNWIVFVVLIILVVCMVIFSTLTVLIEEDEIEIRFGSGIIRRKFPLKDIEAYQVVKSPWYYGWGIRITPRGWLYNVSGFYSVEISMKSGKKYFIGTDVPNELRTAIQQSIERITS